MIQFLIENPLLVYLKRLFFALYYELRYLKRKIRIGTMSSVNNCQFGLYNKISNHVGLMNVEIGDFSYIGDNSQITNTIIGKFCSLSSGIKCGLGMHPTKNFVSTHPIFFSTKRQAQVTFADKDYFTEYTKTYIGNDVWVGADVIILDGVKIGDGAIIGAGAVVTKDVPPYAIMGGVPAKLIRYRFSKKEIEYLIRLKWWNKDLDWLRLNYQKFHNIKNISSLTEMK